MRKPVKKNYHLEPDSKYSSLLVAGFINKIMKDGKKAIAQKIVYGSLEELEKKTKKSALEALDQAIENAGPQVEIRSRRVGGANYQVPYEVKGDRKTTLALRWIINAARSGKGRPMQQKLTEELLNAFNNSGSAVKKKEDTHKMANANRAFAHFAW